MEIKGIIAAMATAMYEDGSINESEIRNQVNRHIQAGVDGIFCLGTNGEFYILSTEEKKRVMRICVDEARVAAWSFYRTAWSPCGYAGHH